MDPLELQLPSRVPLMPLTGLVLMPCAMLPLHIFEERYQEMVSDSLQGHRMFCLPMVPYEQNEDDFCRIAGLGVIRACVASEDGTSNLILQGFKRVRILQVYEDRLYREGEIVEAPSVSEDPALALRLSRDFAKQLIAFTKTGKKLPPQLMAALEDAETSPMVLSDIAAATMVGDSRLMQQFLEEFVVENRLKLLIRLMEQNS